jgi:subfamily B ATP-binding cassette protein MsbA
MLLLVNPIKNLADVATPITRGLAALDRGRRLLEAPAEPTGGNHRSARAQGNLQWQQVSLQYPGAPRHALHQVSLSLRSC